jgi:hypothetical protein
MFTAPEGLVATAARQLSGKGNYHTVGSLEVLLFTTVCDMVLAFTLFNNPAFNEPV